DGARDQSCVAAEVPRPKNVKPSISVPPLASFEVARFFRSYFSGNFAHSQSKWTNFETRLDAGIRDSSEKDHTYREKTRNFKISKGGVGGAVDLTRCFHSFRGGAEQSDVQRESVPCASSPIRNLEDPCNQPLYPDPRVFSRAWRKERLRHARRVRQR